MALAPKVTITESYPACNSIFFEDTTAAYDVDDNPTGYGAPNAEKDDIDSTQIYLVAPGTTTEILVIEDYLPTDGQIEITCQQYTDAVGTTELEEDEEANDACDTCPPNSLAEILGDQCDDGTVACFGNGCWTIIYKVYVGITLTATTTIKQLLRCRMLKDLTDLGDSILAGQCKCRNSTEEQTIHLKYNMLWNDFNRAQLKTNLAECDCSCVTSSLVSIQKRITELQNLCC